MLKGDKDVWLNLIGTVPNDDDFKKWSVQDMSTWLMETTRYVYVPRKSVTNHLYTLWVVTDLELESGRKLLTETLDYLVRDLIFH